MKKFSLTVLSVLLPLAFMACSGNEKENSGAKTVTDLDVSRYDSWVYFSFETGSFQTLDYTSDEPGQWDIALHRNNVKTNRGAALRTDVTNLSELTEIPTGVYVQDTITYEDVVVDNSGMMQGIVVYDTTEVNKILGTWVTHSGMPPVYTVSPYVYVVRNRDGRYAKIKFTSFKNTMDKTGFASFSYEYPFE